MTVQLDQRPLTVLEYHKMVEVGILTEDDPLELLNGQMIYMSPVGSKHAACVEKAVDLLKLLLKDKAMVRTQNPINLSEHSEPEPDLAIVKCKDDFYMDGHPSANEVFFLIEVSDTTLEKDREVKLPIYAQAGVKEYWIVNLNQEEIEVHTNPYNDKYRSKDLYFRGDLIPLKAFNLQVEVDKILI